MTLYSGKTLEELEALANAATEGPCLIGHREVFNAIPALIARIRELEKAIQDCEYKRDLRCLMPGLTDEGLTRVFQHEETDWSKKP